jgi:hypothetical protein
MGTLTADALLDAYRMRLFDRHASYVDVAHVTGLDRPTVKPRIARARRPSAKP